MGGLLTLAFAAGMVAPVNPCGFALLPAWISHTIGDGDTSPAPVRLLHALRAGAALTFAERIRARIAELRAEWPLTVSIGVATLDPDGDGLPEDATALLRAADLAMYHAKRCGKNAVVAADMRAAAAFGLPTGRLQQES